MSKPVLYGMLPHLRLGSWLWITGGVISIPAASWIPDLSGLLQRLAKLVQVPNRMWRDLAHNPYVALGGLPPRIQARRARFWEISSFVPFLHQVFPFIIANAKTALSANLSTWWYFLKVRLIDDGSLFVLQDHRQATLGTAFIKRLQGTRTGFISHVGVHPDYRRQGLGKTMMRELMLPEARRLHLNRMVLNVNTHNHQARYLYESLGFHYYQGQAFDIEVPEGELPMFIDLGPFSEF